MSASNGTQNGARRNGKPKGPKLGLSQWSVWVCPDAECGHIGQIRSRVKGKPFCPRSLHKQTGRYPRLVQVIVDLKDRVA